MYGCFCVFILSFLYVSIHSLNVLMQKNKENEKKEWNIVHAIHIYSYICIYIIHAWFQVGVGLVVEWLSLMQAHKEDEDVILHGLRRLRSVTGLGDTYIRILVEARILEHLHAFFRIGRRSSIQVSLN